MKKCKFVRMYRVCQLFRHVALLDPFFPYHPFPFHPFQETFLIQNFFEIIICSIQYQSNISNEFIISLDQYSQYSINIFFNTELQMAGVIRKKQNPVIFFDIALGKSSLGRIKIQLFADLVPKAAQNFRQFCTGQFKIKEKPSGYKDSCFYRIIPDTLIQGGDFLRNDGTASASIYGTPFEDQTFQLSHDEPGLLSLISDEPNTNGSRFQLELNGCEFLNKKSVIIGKLIDEQSLKILTAMISTNINPNGKPTTPIIIEQCGQM